MAAQLKGWLRSAACATGTIAWSACAVIARLAATGAALRAARVAAFGICSSTRAARATSAALRRDQAFKLVVSAEAFVVQPARLAQLRAPLCRGHANSSAIFKFFTIQRVKLENELTAV